MKYIAALLLLGVVSAHQPESTSLAQLSIGEKLAAMDSESDSDSDENMVQLDGDDGIIDALTPQKGACEERLWISEDEMQWQMDQFARKFDVKNYNNAVTIAGELGKPVPKVHAWKHLNAAFTFPRVRRYQYVQENMDMLEHFEDNLNMNISNSVNVANFAKVGKTVVANLAAKYHNGEFANPADYDPRSDDGSYGYD